MTRSDEHCAIALEPLRSLFEACDAPFSITPLFPLMNVRISAVTLSEKSFVLKEQNPLYPSMQPSIHVASVFAHMKNARSVHFSSYATCNASARRRLHTHQTGYTAL